MVNQVKREFFYKYGIKTRENYEWSAKQIYKNKKQPYDQKKEKLKIKLLPDEGDSDIFAID